MSFWISVGGMHSVRKVTISKFKSELAHYVFANLILILSLFSVSIWLFVLLHVPACCLSLRCKKVFHCSNISVCFMPVLRLIVVGTEESCAPLIMMFIGRCLLHLLQ